MLHLDHFALVAPVYDRVFHRTHVERLLHYLALEPALRLLDVGGGTGRIAQYMMGQVAQVCLLDPSAAMLRQGYSKGICTTRGEAEDLPFPPAFFERIMVVDALHHMCDQARAAGELLRVLAPQGRLVIEEPDITHCQVRLAAAAEKLLRMRSRFLTPETIQKLFSHQNTKTRLKREGSTVWVIIDKV